MNDYLISYEHGRYGYYTAEISAETITEALSEFDTEHEHGEIYGIILKYKIL
jgi:hypothetical protein